MKEEAKKLKFTEREDFKKDMEKYLALTDRVKDLNKQASVADAQTKAMIFHQMIMTIYQFDNHVDYMSMAYPDYYEEYKTHIIDLHKDNEEYVELILSEKRNLNKLKIN